MNDTKISIPNDNKDVEKGNLPKQASVDTSLHMHATENEKEDVCRSVLHKEEEHASRRGKLKKEKNKGVFGQKWEYIVNVGLGSGQFGSPDDDDDDDMSDRRGIPDDPEIRNAFVRKVMAIVFVMLAITSAFIFTVAYVDTLNFFFIRAHYYLGAAGLAGSIIMSCVINSDCARTPPTNYICLALAVIFESVWMGTITSLYDPNLLLISTGVTAGVVFVCILLAFTRIDFTRWFFIVTAVIIALVLLLLVVLLVTYLCDIRLKTVILVLLVVLTIAEVVMLVIELQMVLGGKAIQISVYDYAYGAYILYTSITTIFIHILQIMGLANSD